MRLIILSAGLLGLAACARDEPAPAETRQSPSIPAAPASSPVPPAPAPARTPAIPDRFQGIWDHEKGSCDPASDLRIEIAERGITFHESHGAVTGLTVESPERITVELAMRGEGEKWTMRRTFTLADGGSVLVTASPGDTGEPMPLKRCA